MGTRGRTISINGEVKSGCRRRQYFDRGLKEHGTRYTTNTRATRVVPRTRWEEGVAKAEEKLRRSETRDTETVAEAE